MKVYTRTGDKGRTALLGGTRVSKADDRIHAYGTVDELNSYLGLLRDFEVNGKRRDLLKEVQDRLFTIGSLLASDLEKSKVKVPDLLDSDVELLEKSMDQMSEGLPEMRSFILPGGHQTVSFAHIARCVCRRAERLVIGMGASDTITWRIIQYLNRLSDFLFVLSRKMAQELKVEEVCWKARM
ncbi:cob(I)yrinic acid a,c-diamide adenosyltransferase [Xanthovirga aplysinae]|uniref:cob(I)yrinic acid a,c-diamide adenosyltransferase n=1 Tax=Xanthovirga aplysinae TaxID=2529853 RepID=UPI0012BD1D31|nr:cob(I)yrinic acid a,c-diamide adenosyltransferase [Xanthovirga aplysinae]MTI33122.1 cob(I)yrinic acid a,c-diamide adenosyltransferase [Xanthovirga aplysinae]